MSNFRSRLFEERSELYRRIESLKKFILSSEYDTLPEIDRTDLKEQLSHMKNYFSVVDRRSSRLCDNT